MFKAYDIRGIAGSELTPDFANTLGKAVATHLDASAVAIARDISCLLYTSPSPRD